MNLALQSTSYLILKTTVMTYELLSEIPLNSLTSLMLMLEYIQAFFTSTYCQNYNHFAHFAPINEMLTTDNSMMIQLNPCFK